MSLTNEEGELVSSLENALVKADALSMTYVGIKISEALDQFWLAKRQVPDGTDTPASPND